MSENAQFVRFLVLLYTSVTLLNAQAPGLLCLTLMMETTFGFLFSEKTKEENFLAFLTGCYVLFCQFSLWVFYTHWYLFEGFMSWVAVIIVVDHIIIDLYLLGIIGTWFCYALKCQRLEKKK